MGGISDLAELISEMFRFTVYTYECMLPVANEVASSLLHKSEGAAVVEMLVALGFHQPVWISDCKPY